MAAVIDRPFVAPARSDAALRGLRRQPSSSSTHLSGAPLAVGALLLVSALALGASAVTRSEDAPVREPAVAVPVDARLGGCLAASLGGDVLDDVCEGVLERHVTAPPVLLPLPRG